jgi:hypothetical protein
MLLLKRNCTELLQVKDSVTNSVKCDDEREGAPVQAGVKVRAASIEEGRVLGRK